MSFFAAAPFDEAEAEAHGAVQDEFGETWIHTPCVTLPNRQPQPDNTRPEYALSAIFGWDSALARLGMEETGVSSRTPTLTVLQHQIRYDVQAGDRFYRCKTGDLFQATDRRKDSASGVEVLLTQLGRAT